MASGGVMKSTIAVAGENEYKKAIKACKDVLAEMRAELDLTTASFANDSKSLDAQRAKLDALSKVQDAYNRQLEAEEAAIKRAAENIAWHKSKIAELSDTIEKAKKAQEELKNSVGEGSDEYKKASDQLEDYQKTLKQHSDSLEKAEDKLVQLRTANLKTKTGLEELNNEIRTTVTEFKAAGGSTDDLADGLKSVGEAASEDAEGMDLASLASSNLGKALTAGGLIAGLKMLKDGFDAVIDSSREFESAFAGVLKTVNASPEELDVLRAEILDLSNKIPVTATEISGIAEAAGQLGIQTESIIGFTETMAKLGVATDVTAEQAATLLAQFAKVTDMDPGEYERLGSTIVDLGNNFATTESKIIDMSQRLAGAGATVGLSQADILGVAAALSSLGIEAEAGGSAVSKLLKKIETATKTYGAAAAVIKETGLSVRELELLQDQDAKTYKALAEELSITTSELTNYRDTVKSVTQFAEVSNMTADEFVQKWGEDAVGALVSFTQGLGDTERTGQSAVEILSEMGITEVRMSDAILRLANSGETLTEAQTMANKAWEENIALTVEAEKRYETTDSKVQLLKNSFETFKILVGDQLKPAFDTVVGWLTDMIGLLNDDLNAELEFTKTFVTSSEEIRAAAEEEIQSVLGIRDALEETRKKTEEHSGEVEALITKIEELGSKDNLTAQDEKLLREAIEELNKILPDTIQYYAGLASGSREAASAVRDLLKAEYEYNNYKASREAWEQGQESLKGINKELSEMTAKYNELRKERENLQKEIDDYSFANGYTALQSAGLDIGAFDPKYMALRNDLQAINREIDAVGATIQKTNAARQSLSLTQSQLYANISDYEEAAANAIAAAAEDVVKNEWRMTDETVNAKAEANKQLSALDRIRQRESEAAADEASAAAEKAAAKQAAAAEKAAAAAQKAAEKEVAAEQKAAEKVLDEQAKAAEKALKEQEKADEKARQEQEKAEKQAQQELEKLAKQRGSYFPSDLAKGVKSNSASFSDAVKSMLTDAGNASVSTAQKVGKQIADEINTSMQDALKLGNALSESIAQGKLTVNGKTVGSASSYSLSDLGLNFSQEKYDDWLNAMYAKGFDSSLSGAEIAKILNTGVGVHIGLPSSGTGETAIGYDDSGNLWVMEQLEKGMSASELGLTAGTSPLSDAIKAEYMSQFTERQLSTFSDLEKDRISRERGYYEIDGQAYDYYSKQPVSITNNFNTEVETPATAAKKIQEAVEVALYA